MTSKCSKLKWNPTLGARGLACAVSCFGQVLKSDLRVFSRGFVAREKKPLVSRVVEPRKVS